MKSNPSAILEETLRKPDLHERWKSAYRTPDSEPFFENAFDHIVKELKAPSDSEILDLGCGTGAQSARLAKRGFRVQGIDLSENALTMARVHLDKKGVGNRVQLKQGSLLSLPVENESFDYALCWGVLMHISEVERAVSELSRVVRPGGVLIVSEGNMHSLQSQAFRLLKKIIRKRSSKITRTDSGVEHWQQTPAGLFLTRHANIPWLISEFGKHGFSVRKHIAGQMTDAYTKLPFQILKRTIHGFNHFWFEKVKSPRLAIGNLLIFQKRK